MIHGLNDHQNCSLHLPIIPAGSLINCDPSLDRMGVTEEEQGPYSLGARLSSSPKYLDAHAPHKTGRGQWFGRSYNISIGFVSKLCS